MIDPRFVGLWSEDIMYGPGAQSDEFVVFKSNGTGWIEYWNFILCSAIFFRWDVPEPNYITMLGYRGLDLDTGGDNFVEIEPMLNKVHMPFTLQSEQTPSGKTMNVLRMPLWPRHRDVWISFGFDEHGTIRVREPQAGPIIRKAERAANSVKRLGFDDGPQINSIWKFAGISVDGARFEIYGLNIWEFPWQISSDERAHVQDPRYNQVYQFPIYCITNGKKVVKFAAGEFSNGIWGFYVL